MKKLKEDTITGLLEIQRESDKVGGLIDFLSDWESRNYFDETKELRVVNKALKKLNKIHSDLITQAQKINRNV